MLKNICFIVYFGLFEENDIVKKGDFNGDKMPFQDYQTISNYDI